MKRIKRFIILAMKKKFNIKSPSRWISGTPYADERTYRDLWRLAKDSLLIDKNERKW